MFVPKSPTPRRPASRPPALCVRAAGSALLVYGFALETSHIRAVRPLAPPEVPTPLAAVSPPCPRCHPEVTFPKDFPEADGKRLLSSRRSAALSKVVLSEAATHTEDRDGPAVGRISRASESRVALSAGASGDGCFP